MSKLDQGKVSAVLADHGNGNVGWSLHAASGDTFGGAEHFLLTADPGPLFDGFPGPAVQQAEAQLLHHCEIALTEAGFGVARWRFHNMLSVLIITPDQESADSLSPIVCAFLDEQNSGGSQR